MKKVATVAVAAVLAATAAGTLAGCGSSENEIRIFLLANDREQTFYRQYFEELQAQLQSENLNYTIKFNGEQESSYYDKLDTDFNTGDLPDIFYIRPNEIYTFHDYIAPLQDYADGTGKQYADLTNIYEKALDMYRYNSSTGELGNHNDPLYAFPKDLSTQQLGYNKKALEMYEGELKKANIKMPWDMDFAKENYTWAQYKQMCEIISANPKTLPGKEKPLLCGCDVPSIEVLVKSFGGELIDLSKGRSEAVIQPLDNGPMKKAIDYQTSLIESGAAVYEVGKGFEYFTSGRIAFYGLVGSWEISQYNDYLGEDGWGIMPWPTEDGDTDWQGVITSAGYVVSKECADSEKGDVAKRIAISFMSDAVQERMVKEAKITLPLRKSVADDYRDHENDSVYSLPTRGVFLDVISGDHGFYPATYKTYDATWLDTLSGKLELIWVAGKGKAQATAASTDWAKLLQDMQAQYNDTKNEG